MKTLTASLAEVIYDEIASKNTSVAAVAREADMPSSTLRGRLKDGPIYVSDLFAVALALDVSPTELMVRAEYRRTKRRKATR